MEWIFPFIPYITEDNYDPRDLSRRLSPDISLSVRGFLITFIPPRSPHSQASDYAGHSGAEHGERLDGGSSSTGDSTEDCEPPPLTQHVRVLLLTLRIVLTSSMADDRVVRSLWGLFGGLGGTFHGST